jgi:prefoldin alpha subunit
MDQQLIVRAAQMQGQAEQLEQNIQMIDSQVSELQEFSLGLDSLEKTESKEMFSLMGKGVYLKTSLEEKNIFVDVGSGIILKKTPGETKEVIEEQIGKLKQARVGLLGQLDMYKTEIAQIVQKLESEKKD